VSVTPLCTCFQFLLNNIMSVLFKHFFRLLLNKWLFEEVHIGMMFVFWQKFNAILYFFLCQPVLHHDITLMSHWHWCYTIKTDNIVTSVLAFVILFVQITNILKPMSDYLYLSRYFWRILSAYFFQLLYTTHGSRTKCKHGRLIIWRSKCGKSDIRNFG